VPIFNLSDYFPSKFNNAGKYLTNDGENFSWSALSAIKSVDVLTSGSSVNCLPNVAVVVNLSSNNNFAVNLPTNPNSGDQVIVKDGKGNAKNYNITVNGNGKSIDGSATFEIDENYGSVWLIYNDTQWNAIASIKKIVAIVG
jgi:hypothetical protein